MANLIGQRVRQARRARNPRLTQTDLAAQLQIQGLEINQAQISKIEAKRRPVSDIELAALALALRVSASWLIGETDSPGRLK